MWKLIRSLFLFVVVVASLVLGPVTPASAASLPAEINKQFTPLQIDAGGVSVLRISIFNPNVYPLTNVAFVDDLVRIQPGLYVANPAGIVNTCGGTVTATPSSATISLSGGGVPAQVGPTPGQCYIEVNVSSITPGNLINTIPAHNPPANIGLTAEGNDGGTPVIITNTSPASATITVVAVSSPALSKNFSPNTVFVGGTSTLTITLDNTDIDTNLTGVSYTDTLPAGLVIASPSGLTANNCGGGAIVTGTAGGDTISLSNGTVTPTQNCVITVNVTGPFGQYTNTIPAGPGGPGSIQTNQGVTNNSPASANLNIQPAGITKAFSPTTVVGGNTSTLTITLQNPTGTPYTGVSLTDNLPTGLTVAGTPTTTCGAGTVSGNIGDSAITLTGGTIPASASPPTPNTCTITVLVRAALGASGSRTNTIPANSLSADQPGVTNYLPATSNININSALTGTKAYSPTTIPLGGVSTVTITLTNNSATPLTGINFTDTLPTNLLISGTPTSSQCGGTITNTTTSVTLAGGSLAVAPGPGNTCTITFQVTSNVAGSGTTYENSIPTGAITTAEGVGNNSAITTGTDLTVVNATTLPVGVSKSFLPNTAVPGQASRVRIMITAPVDIGISGISFTDTLPTGVIIATPNPPTIPNPTASGVCGSGTITAVPGSDTIGFNLPAGTLAAGASCNIEVYVVADAPGSYDNIIPATAITTTQGRTNEFASNNANLRVTSMSMSKAFYPTTVQANGHSTLTITLENTSPSALIDVSLNDPLPGTVNNGIRVAAVPNATTTCGGTVTATAGSANIILTGGTIPAQVGGVPGICTISVNVQGRDSTPASPSTQTNTIPVANVTGTVQSSNTQISPFAPATAVLSIQNLSIGVVKGFDPVLVYGGATSTMTVQLINPETTTLTGVAFTDDMASIQPGILLANPVNFNTGTCGGTLTGNPGDSSFSFSGGTLLPNSSCTLTLQVVMNVNGNRTNRISAGAVTTFNGVSSTQPTEASLTNLPGVGITKVFNPNPVQVNDISTLTLTITNTSNIPVVNMGVNDNLPGILPTGLVVADPANVVNTCGGTVTAVPGAQVITLAGGGLAGNGSCSISVDVTTSEPGAYVNTIPSGAITADDGITNNDPTTDTLIVGELFSLGNRVWFDTNNNSVIDPGEEGVDNVTVQLYRADASGNPTGAVVATQTTTQGGYYRFDNLPPGEYVVVIPSTQFNVGGPLAGYLSSGTTIDSAGNINEAPSPDPDTDIDNDDNGDKVTSGTFAGAVVSKAVTLGPGANEPINDTDQPLANPAGEAPNDRSNRTVDFGFYRQTLGDLVFIDVNADGDYDAGTDTPLSGATVQLYSSDGTEINVGPDGILGTADDAPGGVTTGAGGTYLFSGLPAGDYIVRVTPPPGYASTVDTADNADTTNPNTNTDNNDNGVGTTTGTVSSAVVTLTPGQGTGGTAGAPNNTVTQSTGTTANPTVDFGFVSTGLSKTIISTSESFTNGNDVAIGEIVTYRVAIDLPVGATFNDVTITDQLDLGLAFVRCTSVLVQGNDLITSICPPVVTPAVGTSVNPAEDGRQIVFTLPTPIVGALPNPQIVIEYEAIVLDVIENQDGGALNNSVTWAWTGGSYSTSAPNVDIVEPDLSIEKSATPVTDVAIGTPVQFTLVIDHTVPQSTTDAFDVVVSDFLPANLEYVQCTVQYTAGLAPDTPAATYCNPGATTTDLIFIWDVFPLGQTSTITFTARLLGAPATNAASVAWTSLPIDPQINGLPVQLSPHNVTSTERWYDPLDAVNIYSVSDSVTINGAAAVLTDDDNRARLPSSLPFTGFAPNMVTNLPVQPAEKAYTATDVWLEIPRLGVTMPIVGVPLLDEDWDVSWLWNQAGWLEGTAFPGWQGNSALTSHVTLPNGQEGPFAKLGNLKWGDHIIVHAYGTTYTYEVRTNSTISPYNMTVLKHEKDAWLTLITCKDYNEGNNSYTKRIAVRAVLVKVTTDTKPSSNMR